MNVDGWDIPLLPVDVRLSALEVRLAVDVAVDRQCWAIRNAAKHKWGASRRVDNWDHEIVGAVGELAFAKFSDRFWPSNVSGPDEGTDVGPFGVRATALPNGCLPLHPEDADERLFFLVTGIPPLLTVQGYIRAKDGKVETNWREDIREPAWLVKQKDLGR